MVKSVYDEDDLADTWRMRGERGGVQVLRSTTTGEHVHDSNRGRIRRLSPTTVGSMYIC